MDVVRLGQGSAGNSGRKSQVYSQLIFTKGALRSAHDAPQVAFGGSKGPRLTFDSVQRFGRSTAIYVGNL
jgi:hypothetical protein